MPFKTAPRERFEEKRRSATEVVYGDSLATLISSCLLLAIGLVVLVPTVYLSFGEDPKLWKDLNLYLLSLLSFRIVYVGGSIFVGYLVLHLFRRMLSHIDIVLDRTCQSVSFRYNHFLRKPTSVVFSAPQFAEVVVDRFQCQGRQCLCWALWLQRRDGIKNLIDAGNQEKPIRKLAKDLSETLKVPLKDLSNDPPPTTHGPYQTIQQLFDR